MNAQKSLASCTLTTKYQKEKSSNLTYHHTKGIKYIEINLPKETKDLYSENCKMLMKGIK